MVLSSDQLVRTDEAETVMNSWLENICCFQVLISAETFQSESSLPDALTTGSVTAAICLLVRILNNR